MALPLHARLRALLRATCNGSFQFSGRDQERTIIKDFVQSFASKDTPTTLYISGAPGSGKTALVNSVFDTCELSDVKIISINCMALDGVDALWLRLVEEMESGKETARGKTVSGRGRVERVLSNLRSKWLVP